MLIKILAAAVLVSAGTAQAAVYAPSFAGPDLDPSISVVEGPGFTHTVGFGTLVISKLAGAGFSGATFVPDIHPNGDFNARLSVDLSQLGNNAFEFGFSNIYYYSSFYVNHDIVSTRLTYDFSDTPSLFEARTGNEFLFEYSKINGVVEMFVNGVSKQSLYKGDNGSLDFFFQVSNTYNVDPNYTTAFVSDFRVTTPDICGIAAPCTSGTPEPASWALLIAGFGLTGAAMRRRRFALAAS